MTKVKKSVVAPHGTAKKLQVIPGAEDYITSLNFGLQKVMRNFELASRVYGFARADLPLVEDEALYQRAEQFLESRLTLTTLLGDRTLALRASLLPQVLRAYGQVKLPEGVTLQKWSYSGPVTWVGEKHQLKNNYEFGWEVFGQFNHLTEAQVISCLWHMCEQLGLTGAQLEINSSGTKESQFAYGQELAIFLKPKKYDLCDECTAHLENNVLLVLRCPNLDCQALFSEAPTMLDFLDADSRTGFTSVLEALEELQIPYQLNPLHLAKPGGSLTSAVLKFRVKNETIVVGEASYHTDLSGEFFNKPQPSFGFSGSFENLILVLDTETEELVANHKDDVFLVPLGELAAKKSLRLFRDLVSAQVSVYDLFGHSGVKNQLKAAQESHSPIALIMGQKEASEEMVILRDVKSGMQEMFSYDKIVDEVKKRLGK